MKYMFVVYFHSFGCLYAGMHLSGLLKFPPAVYAFDACGLTIFLDV